MLIYDAIKHFRIAKAMERGGSSVYLRLRNVRPAFVLKQFIYDRTKNKTKPFYQMIFVSFLVNPLQQEWTLNKLTNLISLKQNFLHECTEELVFIIKLENVSKIFQMQISFHISFFFLYQHYFYLYPELCNGSEINQFYINYCSYDYLVLSPRTLTTLRLNLCFLTPCVSYSFSLF